MHTCLHVHVHAHVFTHRLRGDLCMARFQLEVLWVTRVLRAWGGILATEDQAVSCWPHTLGQGGGRGPCYCVQGTQGPPHSWGGSAHLRLPKSHALHAQQMVALAPPPRPAPPPVHTPLKVEATAWLPVPGTQFDGGGHMETEEPGEWRKEGENPGGIRLTWGLRNPQQCSLIQ